MPTSAFDRDVLAGRAFELVAVDELARLQRLVAGLKTAVPFHARRELGVGADVDRNV